MQTEYSVLLIEDNVGDQVLVAEYLSESKIAIQITLAETFSEARSLLERQKFDIILLDLSLPDKDGQDLIQSLKRVNDITPIVILTGYSDEAFATKSLALGASDYLLKDELNPLILQKSIIYNLERNKILVNLKESEQRYSDLFHLSPQPMWVYELGTFKFLDVNEAAILRYGYSYEEFLELRASDIRPNNEELKLRLAVEKLKLSTNNSYIGNTQHRTKDGRVFDVEVRSNIIQFKGTKAAIVLVNDLTEINRHIKAVEVQNDKLKSIAWTQSHVVRAPLARLMGLVDFFANDRVSEKEKEVFMNYIKDSANELDGIVRKMVEEAQEIAIKDDDIDLNEDGSKD